MTDEDELAQHLESAHAALTAARKIAALSNHPSYNKIGNAINSVESAILLTESRPAPMPHVARSPMQGIKLR